MRDVIRVKGAAMFPLVLEILEQGQKVRIVVVGDSMYPFLRDGLDRVELAKTSFEALNRGDIVLIRRTDGTYVMHRVYRKEKGSISIVGDAQQWLEGPLFPSQIVALVTAVLRKENYISCSNWLWRSTTGLWLVLRPFRYFLLRVARVVNKLVRITQFRSQ